MSGKTLALTALLWMLTGCRQEQLSLPVTHAAVSQPQSATAIAAESNPLSLEPGASCYKFMLLRPKDQRATAVQARLKQADAMVAVLERTLAVPGRVMPTSSPSNFPCLGLPRLP